MAETPKVIWSFAAPAAPHTPARRARPVEQAPKRMGRPTLPMPDLDRVRKLKGEGFGAHAIATQLETTVWVARKALALVQLCAPLRKGRADG